MEKNVLKSAFSNRIKQYQIPYEPICKIQQPINDHWSPMVKKKEFFRISKKQLQQMVRAEVQRRVLPLMKRIQKLQYDRSCLGAFSKNGQQSYFENIDDISNNFQEEAPLQQEEQSENLSTYWTPPPSKKRSLNEILKKQSMPLVASDHSDVTACCQRLDQIVVSQQNQAQWNILRNRMKQIFNYHAARGNIWAEQSKRFVVKFVDFGITNMGFRKTDMINLAKVSNSSYKRWKKMY